MPRENFGLVKEPGAWLAKAARLDEWEAVTDNDAYRHRLTGRMISRKAAEEMDPAALLSFLLQNEVAVNRAPAAATPPQSATARFTAQRELVFPAGSTIEIQWVGQDLQKIPTGRFPVLDIRPPDPMVNIPERRRRNIVLEEDR